jgi:hypothetical protein
VNERVNLGTKRLAKEIAIIFKKERKIPHAILSKLYMLSRCRNPWT